MFHFHPAVAYHHRRKHSNPYGWLYDGASRTTLTGNSVQDLPTGAGSAWTISLWVKLTSNAGSGGSWLYGQGNYDANSSCNIYFYQASHASANKLEALVKGNDAVSSTITTVTTPGTSRVWQNIILTYDFDTTSLTLYVDGTDEALDPAFTFAGIGPATPNIAIADSTDVVAAETDGAFKDVAMWDSLLSAGNIAAIAAGGKAANISPAPTWNVKMLCEKADSPAEAAAQFAVTNSANVVGLFP